MAAKVKTNLSHSDDGEFYNETIYIFNSLDKYEDDFVGLPVDADTLKEAVDAFDKVRNALLYPNKSADTIAARKVVQKIITKNGNWLNTYCDGDEALLGKTGYPLQEGFSAQGKLDKTDLKMTGLVKPGTLGYEISNLKIQGIRYGLMYTLVSNEEENPAKWSFHYCASREGIIGDLISKEKYKFVSFAMGTDADLTYSTVVFMGVV